MVLIQPANSAQHLLLFATLALSLAIFFYPTPTHSLPLFPGEAEFEYKRYCSSNLSEAIHLICGGRYYSLGRKFPDSLETGSNVRYPLQAITISRLVPDELSLHRPLQNNAGAIHECCLRPCGYTELKMYCSPDK